MGNSKKVITRRKCGRCFKMQEVGKVTLSDIQDMKSKYTCHTCVSEFMNNVPNEAAPTYFTNEASLNLYLKKKKVHDLLIN